MFRLCGRLVAVLALIALMEIPARSQEIDISQVEATVHGKTCPGDTRALPFYKKVKEICPEYDTRSYDPTYHDGCLKEFVRRNDLIRAYDKRMEECVKASGQNSEPSETTTKSKFSDRLKDATKRAEGAEKINKRNANALSSDYQAAVQQQLQADEEQEATRRLQESVRRHTAEVRKQLKNEKAEVTFDLTRCTHIDHGEGYVTCWLTHGWDGPAQQCEPPKMINGTRYTYCRDDE